ncbi:MAG: hypothetical protein J5621_06205 [Paludibacteraceae bacterium]|nr:hypothetical protein [Paludibacteraceae bacterium]
MKLQRIYHKVEDLSFPLRCVHGDTSCLCGKEAMNSPKDEKYEEISFGFSYVTNMIKCPYSGRYGDCYAAIDLYANNKHLMGIPLRWIDRIKLDLESKGVLPYVMAVYLHGHINGEICRGTGVIELHAKTKFSYYTKYDFYLTFTGHKFCLENDYSICLENTEVPRLLNAFFFCQRELYKHM